MSNLPITTTQNVTINFKLASVGVRMLAYLIDMLIKGAYITSVYYLFEFIKFEDFMNDLDDWSIIAILIIIAFPTFIYTLVLESIFEGQTLGKKICQIKVVKTEGYQASFGDHLTRWLFRVVDLAIGGGVVAVISIIISKYSQRLGDIASDTTVISIKKDTSINHTIIETIQEDYTPIYASVLKLNDQDVNIIKEAFTKAKYNNDKELFQKLTNKIESVIGVKNTQDSDIKFIETILKDYNYYTQKL